MSQASSEHSGVAANLVSGVADQVDRGARRLAEGDLERALDDVKRVARNRPEQLVDERIQPQLDQAAGQVGTMAQETAEAVKPAVQDAVAEVKDNAEQAVAEVKDSAASSAADVADEAKGTVAEVRS